MMEVGPMERVGKGTGGVELSTPLARTCLYRVSWEGGDVQLAIAAPAGSRGIRSSHRKHARAAGDRGGRRDRRRSLRLSSQETAQGTFLSLFILSFFFWRSL